MTDNTPDFAPAFAPEPSADTRSRTDIDARIDALVAHASSRHSAAAPLPTHITPKSAHENWRYETATDTMLNLDTGTRVAADDYARDQAEKNAGQRIHDDGRSLDAELAQMGNEINRLGAKLNEARYDPVTGRKEYVLQGQQRYAHEVMQKQLITSFQDQARINARIQMQRDADRELAEQVARDELEAEAAIEREVQRRVLALEVEERARAALAAKKRIAHGG